LHFYTPTLHSVIPPRIITTINIATSLFIIHSPILISSKGHILILRSNLF